MKILHLAAYESEAEVNDAIRVLLAGEGAISFEAVRELVDSKQELKPVTDVRIDPVDLSEYDDLCVNREVA